MNALIPDFELGVPETENRGTHLLIDEIVPNRNQPRKYFDDEKLNQLVESIREKGIIQPIVVQRIASGHEIIVGERRWRAAKKAGLKKIPVVITEASDAESLEIAIIENIHREDLNPIEEALAYSKLAKEFGMKQEQIAKRVGKNRASVANYMRLLKLSRSMQEDLIKGSLTMGHARALLALQSEKEIEKLRCRILKEKLNVRQTELLVKKFSKQDKPEPKKKVAQKDLFLKNLEIELGRKLETKVEIMASKKGGKLLISYYSDEDLERIREKLISKIF